MVRKSLWFVGTALAGALVAFCVFGFLATWEPPVEDVWYLSPWLWRLIDGTVGVACAFAASWSALRATR